MSAMEDGQLNSSSHNTVLFDGGARRAEAVRVAATKALFELDSNEAARRALVGRASATQGVVEAA